MNENLGRMERVMRQQTQKLEDDANMKTAVLVAAKRLLPEVAIKYELNGNHVAILEEAIEEALIEFDKEKAFIRPNKTELELLRDVAALTLERALKKFQLQKPGLVDFFRRELQVEMRIE